MQRVSKYAFRFGVVIFVCVNFLGAAAVVATETLTNTSESSPISISHDIAIAELKKLQSEQDRVKQQASTVKSQRQLTDLIDVTQRLIGEVDKLKALLLPERAQLQTQLDVLGPPPLPGAAAEMPAVVEQREELNTRKSQLDDELKQASSERQNFANLAQQLNKLQRSMLKEQLALRSGSILGFQFWAPVFNPKPEDREGIHTFVEQTATMFGSAWERGQRITSAALLLLAFSVWVGGRHIIERLLAWVSLHRLPEGRLRRSAFALSSVLATVFATGMSVQVIYFLFTRQHALPPTLQQLADEIATLTLTSALIAGLGRALLCTRRPTWRLPSIADPVALAMRPFPSILAGLLLLSGTLEQLNRIVDTSLQVTLFGRGLVSLVVALTIGASLLRANRVRTSLAALGEPPEARSTLAGLIHAGVSLAVLTSLCALLTGYISIARFLTYELVWFEIVLCSLYLLTQLTKDACESVFSMQNPSGKVIKHLFGLGDAHLEQASTILSGIGSSLLLLIAIIALLTGGFGTTPSDLFNSVTSVVGGEHLRRFNIVPGHILHALIALAVGIYLVRSLRKWLDFELLPTVRMDPGMQASLTTLFSNIGYVVVVLLTLSLLGVRWSNLAWIVSALSVGIGFGLQEIVKNFVSGLILLTERPVKVGDMISISGVEGDIRRINVRATEIQLSDRSTVIVPNSQLISQNLRNVTMGNSTQGVATLMLTFPLNTDPEKVRDLLLGAFHEHIAILEKPAPSVIFSQLAPDGITLSVTGYVSSPRITGSVKSDLLFEILKRLRGAGISLANPQMLMVQNQPTTGV